MTEADKGARLGNFIVNSLIVVVVTILMLLLVVFLDGNILYETPLLTNIVFVIVSFTYYLFFELFFGKTPGKFLTKTKVVDNNGNKPSIKKLLIRTLLRLLFMATGIFSFLFGTYGLHDGLSGTRVVTIQSD